MQTNLAMQPKYLPKQTHKSASRPLRRPQVPPTLQARARFEQTNFCRHSLSYCRQGLCSVDKVCHLVDVSNEFVYTQTTYVKYMKKFACCNKLCHGIDKVCHMQTICHMCRMCRQTLSCCRQSLSYVDKSCHNADKPGHAAKISPKANP